MITEKPHNINWNFFISLEKDLENISRYIEFSESNRLTYSIELSRILFAASSEVDVIAKQLCKLINPMSKAQNIKNYRMEITQRYPEFSNAEIFIERYGLNYKPSFAPVFTAREVVTDRSHQARLAAWPPVRPLK